jgi:hypothetical protein
MFEKNLVHAIIGGKDPDRGSAGLTVALVLTRGHGALLLDLRIRPGGRYPFGSCPFGRVVAFSLIAVPCCQNTRSGP